MHIRRFATTTTITPCLFEIMTHSSYKRAISSIGCNITNGNQKKKLGNLSNQQYLPLYKTALMTRFVFCVT